MSWHVRAEFRSQAGDDDPFGLAPATAWLGGATLFALPCGTAASNRPYIVFVERGPVEQPKLRCRDADGTMRETDAANVSWDPARKVLTSAWGAGVNCTGTCRWRRTGQTFRFLSDRRTRGCGSEQPVSRLAFPAEGRYDALRRRIHA